MCKSDEGGSLFSVEILYRKRVVRTQRINRKGRIMNKIMITGALLALLASVSMAGIISVNFCDNQPVSRNPMLTSSLAGALGVRANNIKSI